MRCDFSFLVSWLGLFELMVKLFLWFEILLIGVIIVVVL